MKNLFGEEYGRKARLFPALLCSLPFLIIKHFILDYYFGASFGDKLSTIVFQDLSLVVVLVYLLTQINRFVSKYFFENKSKFPTTLMLLPSSKELSMEFRGKINNKIFSDFGISLPTEVDEKTDLKNTENRIKEIVSLIIHRVGNGTLLLQHNIEYGFMRNFIGGSVVSLTFSLGCMFIFQFLIDNHTAYILSVILTVAYLMPILFSKHILASYSNEYAKILFREYLGN